MASSASRVKQQPTSASNVHPNSPWQAFQGYLMERIASVRHFTSIPRRAPREDSVIELDSASEAEARAYEEYVYLYGTHDANASPVMKLPQEILLNIFSLLGVHDLCSCAQVCRLWRKVSEDPLMWSARLVEESHRWPYVSSHTFIDKELTAAAPAKMAYLRCSPEFGGASASPGLCRRVPTPVTPLTAVGGVSTHVSNLWRSWFPRKNPRFLLSEGDPNLKFMRRILHDKFTGFVPVSMFSTEWFLNAGLTYQMKSDNRDVLFDLVTFGSNPRVESQLFEPIQPPPVNPTPPDPGGHEPMEEGHDDAIQAPPDTSRLRLGADFARYVHLIDGLIFVINAENTGPEFLRRRAEYQAFVDSLRDRPSVPVLFLSLVSEDESARQFSCVDIARYLGLISLTNPWIICDGRSRGLHRVSEGFSWLVQRAN